MNYLTTQQIFDRAALHLLTQNEKSEGIIISSGESELKCRYRTKVGDKTLMCGAGPFIPDDKYSGALENKTIYGLAMNGYCPEINIDDLNSLPLLTGLQGIHDCKKVSEWKQALINLAYSFSLNYKCVSNFGNNS